MFSGWVNWAKNRRHGHIQIPSRTCIYCSNIFKYIHAYIPFHSIPFLPEGQYVRRINMYIYIYIHASESLYSSSTLVRHPPSLCTNRANGKEHHHHTGLDWGLAGSSCCTTISPASEMIGFPKVKATIEGRKSSSYGVVICYSYSLLLYDIYLPIENRIFWTRKFPK